MNHARVCFLGMIRTKAKVKRQKVKVRALNNPTHHRPLVTKLLVAFYLLPSCLLILPPTNCSFPAAISQTSPASARPLPTQAARTVNPNSPPSQRVINASLEQISYTFSYDPAYVKLGYPGGDVPLERGVCADVVIRAFRKAGVDLQKEVHEDMAAHFAAYPNHWGASKPDHNIDHRRVANLMAYLERQGKSLAVSSDPQPYQPGDVVAWDLGHGRLHIGMVSDVRVGGQARYAVVHNIGAGAKLEDLLFAWKIIGHYRFFAEPKPMPSASRPPASRPPARHHRRR
jgi:hypothetical protein